MRHYQILLAVFFIILCNNMMLGQGKISRPNNVQNKNIELTESGKLNGHGYVDLGLPSGTKWASCNMGASSPSDFGQYYAWGDLMPREKFFADGSFKGAYPSLIKRSIGGNIQYDAATKSWGKGWRMPSKADFDELNGYCKWEYVTINKHNGYLVTGPNGKRIFFPFASGRCGNDNFMLNERAVYRTSDCQSYGGEGSEWGSLCFTIERDDSYGSHRICETYPETNGFSIRPITR